MPVRPSQLSLRGRLRPRWGSGAMYEYFGLFIDGAWRTKGGQGTLNIVDPATGETIETVPAADKADVDEAIAAAEAGFTVWRSMSAWARADLLHAVANIMHGRTDEAA